MNKYIQKFRENIAKLNEEQIVYNTYADKPYLNYIDGSLKEWCEKENDIILDEAKQVGRLYHATTIAALEDILKSDKLISSAFSGTGTSQGISTTRDKTFFYHGPLSIILDGNKLSENYKVIPFSALDDLDGYEHRAEHETVIIPNNLPKDYDIWDTEFIIPNIHKYIIGILVKPNLFASKGQTEDLYNILKNYNYPIYSVYGQQLDINKFNYYHKEMLKLSNKSYNKDEELNNRYNKVRDTVKDKESDHYSIKDKLIHKLQQKKLDKELDKLLLQKYGKTSHEIWEQNHQYDYGDPRYIDYMKEYEQLKKQLYNTDENYLWHKFK